MIRTAAVIAAVLAAYMTLSSAASAQSGCTITIRVRNNGDRTVGFIVGNVMTRSGTSTALVWTPYLGPWVSLRSGGWLSQFSAGHVVRLQPQQRIEGRYQADFRCDAWREVRVPFQCLSGPLAATNFVYSVTDSYSETTRPIELTIGSVCR